jgi:hypothetical protein
MLEHLEAQARDRGLLLRVQVGRPLGQWSLRMVVARPIDASRVQLLGEMKGWAYNAEKGLQLDTMRVIPLPIGGGWGSDLGRHDGLGPGEHPMPPSPTLGHP